MSCISFLCSGTYGVFLNLCVTMGSVKDPNAQGLVKTVFNEGAKQGSLSCVDTELEGKSQNTTVDSLVQGTSVLRDLVELDSLEAAAGHRDRGRVGVRKTGLTQDT